MRRLLISALLLPTLGGCVSTAAAVVTAPFKVAGAAVDAVTTSQEEADRNRGRALRKEEEREARHRRKMEREERRERERDDD